MYRILSFLFVLILTIPAVSAQDEPDIVKIQILPFLAYAPFYIAEEAGYYDEYNIDLEIVEFDNSAAAIPALIQGELDVTLGYLNFGAINALDRGANLKFVAGFGYIVEEGGCISNSFFLSNQVADSIQSPSDLEGRTIYIPQGVPQYYLEVLLAQDDLTLEDVELDYVPPPAAVEGLASGSIEVTQFPEPWYTLAVSSEAGQPWISFEEILPNVILSGITFGETMLNREDVATRFLIATQKGMEQYSEGPTEENLDIISTYTGFDHDLLSELCWRRATVTGSSITNGLDDYLVWAFENEFIDFIPEPKQYFDSTFIEAASEVIHIPEDVTDNE